MSIDPNVLTATVINRSKKSVDRSIRTMLAELEHENTLIADPPATRVQKVLKIYRGIKPLLTVVAELPLLPATWRAALHVFLQALDSLAAVGGDISAAFKAGRDL